MSGCCSCSCKPAHHDSFDVAAARGPDVQHTANPCQIQVIVDECDSRAGTGHVSSKRRSGWKDRLSTLLNPFNVSGDVKGMRQCSRNECAFTEEYLTGSIKFMGMDSAHLKHKRSKYIAIHPEEDVNAIVMAMEQKWNLHFPKLLICILGGDTLTPAYKTMEKSFRKGLVEAILRTDVWLFTGGLNCGMMKSVGRALTSYAIGRAMVKNRDVVAVGVAPLGALKQKDKFQADERKSVMYDLASGDKGEAGQARDGDATPTYHLEPNHTHFILVGDQDSKPGDEASLRTELVNNIASREIKGSKAKVSVLYLLFGGDAASIQTVYDAVMEQKIPVLIIPDSGGAADVLSLAINRTQNVQSPTGKDMEFDIEIYREIEMKLHLDPQSHVGVKIQIKEIIKRRHLINIYRQEVGIEEAILGALMKANRGCKDQDALLLAVIWNRIDLARKDLKHHQEWKDDELKDSLEYALVNNQHKFVKLFLDEGKIDLQKFLSVEMLTDLYGQVSESSPLYSLLEERRGKRVKQSYTERGRFTLKEDVSNLLKKLIFDTYEHMYDSDAIYDSEDKTYFREPLRELFMWAVLYHRFHLAKLFWKRGKPSIGGALVGCKLLRVMSEMFTMDPQESAKMATHANEFQKMAIELLNHCYTEDRRQTSLLLVRELPDWGNSTCLDLAAAGRSKQFIAHAAVQNLLSELWMGRLSRYTGLFKIWSCICFPFAIPFVLTFMSKDDPSVPANQMVADENAEDAIDSGPPLEDLKSSKSGKNRKDSYVRYTAGNDEADDNVSMRTYTSHMQHSSNRVKSLSWWYKFKLFHEAPVISFRLNAFSHFLFLGLFSYILLANFHEEISIQEMVLIGWVFTLFTEEMRQFLQEDFHTLYHRFEAWFWGYWSFIDLVSLVMFAIGVGLRFHPGTLDAARIVLALDLIVFYLRILHIFSASKVLGPKLIMIVRMFVDLVTFLAILMVFLIAYGVACHSVMFPNATDPTKIMKGVFYQSYFQLHGQLFLDDFNKEGCAADNVTMTGGERCPEHSWFGVVFLAFYLFISRILLLSLLIAMLNYTIHAIQENTDTYWKFQRYQLIKEYYQRPAVIPPFIIVSHVYQVIRWAWDLCCPNHKMYRSPNLMKKELRQEKLIKISTWEEVKGEDYLAEKTQSYGDANKRMKQAEEKLEAVSSKMSKYFDGARLNKAMEGRFNKLEAQIGCLEQLIKSQGGMEAADSAEGSSNTGHLQALAPQPTDLLARQGQVGQLHISLQSVTVIQEANQEEESHPI